jgi:hypothetical protein
VTGYGAGRLVWWLCRPSLGRALLCGFGAIYVGTFIGADAVTMFCAAQGARLLFRVLARRSVRVEPAFLTSRRRDASTFAPTEPDADVGFVIAGGYAEASHAPVPRTDPEPELTLDELIAGDPGPEPGDPGPELDEPVGGMNGADGDETAPIGASVDGHPLVAWDKGKVSVCGSDAAEALRLAVAVGADGGD